MLNNRSRLYWTSVLNSPHTLFLDLHSSNEDISKHGTFRSPLGDVWILEPSILSKLVEIKRISQMRSIRSSTSCFQATEMEQDNYARKSIRQICRY